MKDYRDVLKEHFGSRSPWKSLLGIDYVFYGVGLLFLILSACLMNTYGVWYDMFGTLGLLCVVFGLFLAFIKKDEWGMLITTGVCALYYLVMFIVIAVQSSRYIGLLQISELLYALVFGGLFAGADDFQRAEDGQAAPRSDHAGQQQCGAQVLGVRRAP